jgi:hypothetical protein
MHKKVVYFICCNGKIKIGFTSLWASRRRNYELKFGLVEELGIIPGDRAKERAMHERFAPFNLHGEWFENCPAAKELISAVLSEPHEVPEEFDHRWMGRILEEIFPTDTAVNVHRETGFNIRTCKRYVTGESRAPHRFLRAMLLSDQGELFLRILMRGCQEEWWLEFEEALNFKDELKLKRAIEGVGNVTTGMHNGR